MPYVERDTSSKVVGFFANPQPGYAEEWLDDNSQDLLDYLSAQRPVLTTIYKADIWRRTTDEEAVTIDQTLKGLAVRMQRMWQDSTYLTTTDELFPMINAAFVSAFGPARAALLLEPTA